MKNNPIIRITHSSGGYCDFSYLVEALEYWYSVVNKYDRKDFNWVWL